MGGVIDMQAIVQAVYHHFRKHCQHVIQSHSRTYCRSGSRQSQTATRMEKSFQLLISELDIENQTDPDEYPYKYRLGRQPIHKKGLYVKASVCKSFCV